jgi:hypothetical protein
MSNCLLAVHGHFYQPPRTDPFTGVVPAEPDAAPYANWNERITAECYAPNAEAGHFGQISLNLGETLAGWLEMHAYPTYSGIIAAVRGYRARYGLANALAQPFHHTILPLASHRDKECQLRWGIAAYEHRFGQEPLGIWLPEMAVDYETLETAAAEGLAFTVLSQEQVRGQTGRGAGPYGVRLGGGRQIGVFVRDRALSDELSFQMPELPAADEWIRDRVVGSCSQDGPLLIATDGETFGHHHRQGVDFLARLLAGEKDYGYSLTTLGMQMRDSPPEADVEVVENTAWSCTHGLDRWAKGCACTVGDSAWKRHLRRALDHLAGELDGLYEQEAAMRGADAWPLRDGYVTVVLGETDGPSYLSQCGLGHLAGQEAERLVRLLESQFYRQQMYASCAWFFDDLGRPEPRYAMANAARAALLADQAAGANLLDGLQSDLAAARSGVTRRTGAQIVEELLAQKPVRG